MIEILNNYCNSENGLLLFDPPTGSGKTYNVLKWIFENYKNHCKDGRKIFFVTNLKKNLPIGDLKIQHFAKQNKIEDFNNHVLFLNSNMGFVLENFEEVKDNIPEYFSKLQVYRSLKSKIRLVNKLKSSQNFKDVLIASENELRTKYEPEFRRRIELYLKENYPNKRERLKAIKTESDLKWIGKLYPSVFSSERKIFFLSIDKFYAQNSTLVEPSYHFIDHDITKNAIIFIDEIDATKDSILNNIIEKGKRRRIDYIHLFNEIYWALSNNTLPTDFLIHSKNRQQQIDKGYNYKDLKDIENVLKSMAEEVVKKYNVTFSFKTTMSPNISRERNLLFHDFQYHAVYRNNHRYIKIDTDFSQRMNLLQFTDEKPDDNSLNVITLLNQIKGYITYFQGAVKSLAQNYQETLNERRHAAKSHESEYAYDLALSTVLEEFRLEGKYKAFIMDNILAERESTHSSDKSKPAIRYDLSVYENGFRYYDFIDDEQHETITKTFIYDFNNTPEKFLLKLAERAKVVGISATAKIETVTGNYDISYLKKQLGSSFFELTTAERENLQSYIQQQNENYKDVTIHPIWIKNYKDSEVINGFIKLFEDEELARDILAKIDSPQPFIQSRYLRIAQAFDKFIFYEDINAMLCLLNKEPREWDDKLRSTTLEEIFDILIEKHNVQESFRQINKDSNQPVYDVKNSYRIINSADFDLKKEDFTEQLQRGQKLFLISMYQTVGAGQNLHYASPDTTKLVDVRSKELLKFNLDKTDINAIYLDKPTHLIQLVNKQLDEEGFIRYLFQLEFLLEAGRISIKTLRGEVTRAFQNLMASLNSNRIPKRSNASLYDDYNIKQHYSKYIIQAIGRICRTNLKAKNIYILADDELKDHIASFDLENNIVLKEFEALVLSCQKKITSKKNNEVFVNKAIMCNRKTLSRILRFLKRDWEWRDKDILEWQQLREQCLIYPTITEERAKELIGVLDVYVELAQIGKSYSYQQENDFQSVKIDFDNKLPSKVSETSARLQTIMTIPGLKVHFEAKNFATEFHNGIFILSPVLFHNVYKGALGEEAGRYIFENELDIPLEELPKEDFELFDFKIKGTNVYVDFKHWQEYTQFDASIVQNKILRKLEKVKGSQALIVNILAVNNYRTITGLDGRIIEIGNLYDEEEKSYNAQAVKKIIEVYEKCTG